MLTRPAEPIELRDENNISLAVRDATVGYAAAPIVHDVSLTVSRGTIVCVIGPNGAGKSTLLKALTGRLRPFSGRVLLGGADVTGATGNELARFGLGYVPQSGDNVMVAGRIAVSSEPAPLLAEPDFGELFLGARAPDRRAADLQATDVDAASREPVDGSAASHDTAGLRRGQRHEETGGGE